MREDLREQPSGRRSLMLEEIVHCFEGFEVFERQVSVTVKLSFSWKWKSSNKGLGAGDTVAFTDM